MPKTLRCRVVEIQDHGGHVYSIFLKPESPAPDFLPGQYLNLALDEYSPGGAWPESRAFSIASAPAERSLLRITYAVKGQFSARMEAGVAPGVSGMGQYALWRIYHKPGTGCLPAGGWYRRDGFQWVFGRASGHLPAP